MIGGIRWHPRQQAGADRASRNELVFHVSSHVGGIRLQTTLPRPQPLLQEKFHFA
jgi:hypothetical protein